jgi:hypothetical protein
VACSSHACCGATMTDCVYVRIPQKHKQRDCTLCMLLQH